MEKMFEKLLEIKTIKNIMVDFLMDEVEALVKDKIEDNQWEESDYEKIRKPNATLTALIKMALELGVVESELKPYRLKKELVKYWIDKHYSSQMAMAMKNEMTNVLGIQFE